jgi:elongator complex protein 3
MQALLDEGKKMDLAAILAVETLKTVARPTPVDVQAAKQRAAAAVGCRTLPRNSDLLRHLGEDAVGLKRLLITKKTRSLSGVAVVAAMTKPLPCPPQAQCIYCPGGPAVDTPKSYTGREPAAMRGAQCDYDPYLEATTRLRQLEEMGHGTGKVEVIVMGGTFTGFPEAYRRWFVKGLYDGLNGGTSSSLEEAIARNEVSQRRCIGLTIETRPDCLDEQTISSLLSYGTTRVELGVQSLDDEVLAEVRRGHTVSQTAEAFSLSKDAGLKVVAHMMTGLPGSDPSRDLASFRTLFEDERFKPDMLKVYPTLVVKSAPLHRLYLEGRYRPYTLEETVELVSRVKGMAPPWLRIMRVQRDIPACLIEAGTKAGNLRELAKARLEELGGRCRCIRCREVGLNSVPPDRLEAFSMKETRYRASGGEEVFISFEDEGERIAGFVRLRLPSDPHRPEMDEGSAIVRELRVYGKLVAVGGKAADGWQHRGLGAALMRRAEEVAAAEYGMKELLVTSAVGTRQYYAKLGYYRKGPYMAKRVSA